MLGLGYDSCFNTVTDTSLANSLIKAVKADDQVQIVMCRRATTWYYPLIRCKTNKSINSIAPINKSLLCSI
jgi:hypothetical protein